MFAGFKKWWRKLVEDVKSKTRKIAEEEKWEGDGQGLLVFRSSRPLRFLATALGRSQADRLAIVRSADVAEEAFLTKT